MDMDTISTGPRRRILHGLTLDAIAAVDEPCQEHAKMAIIKRRPDRAELSRAPSRETVTQAPARFADAVAKIVTRDGIGRADAMAKARREHPDLHETAYRATPPAEDVPKAEDERAKNRMNFLAAAHGIAARDRIGFSSAMMKARRERSDLFDAAYG